MMYILNKIYWTKREAASAAEMTEEINKKI